MGFSFASRNPPCSVELNIAWDYWYNIGILDILILDNCMKLLVWYWYFDTLVLDSSVDILDI